MSAVSSAINIEQLLNEMAITTVLSINSYFSKGKSKPGDEKFCPSTIFVEYKAIRRQDTIKVYMLFGSTLAFAIGKKSLGGRNTKKLIIF